MTRGLAGVALRRIVAIGGGLVFLGSLLYFAASFIWRFEREPSSSAGTLRPILVDLGLFTVFSLHHTLFARTPLKAWIRRTIPPELERSAYVWIASVLFIATCAWWQPVPGLAWRAGGLARTALQLIQLAAAVFTVVCARRLSVLHLAGVSQVFPGSDPARRKAGQTPSTRPASDAGGQEQGQTPLDDRGPYGLVRHPIYLGWLLMVWAAPTMNGTRLVFAFISSAYLALAIPFEERDLRATFGAAYDDYRRRVRWRMVPFVY